MYVQAMKNYSDCCVNIPPNIPYSAAVDWNNPGSIIDSQFVFSITAKVIEYQSNNYQLRGGFDLAHGKMQRCDDGFPYSVLDSL